MNKYTVYRIVINFKEREPVHINFDSEKLRDETFIKFYDDLRKVDYESRMFFKWDKVVFNVFEIVTVQKQEETFAAEKEDEIIIKKREE